MASRNISSTKGLGGTGKPGGGSARSKANHRRHTIGKNQPGGGDGGMRRRIAELEAALSTYE